MAGNDPEADAPFLGPLLGTGICSSLELRDGTSCPITEVPPPMSSHAPRIAFKQRRGKAGGPTSIHFPPYPGRAPAHPVDHLGGEACPPAFAVTPPITENSSTVYSVPALCLLRWHVPVFIQKPPKQIFLVSASASSLPPCPLAMHVPFSGVVFLKQKPDAIEGFLRHRSKIQGLCQQAATSSYLCPLLTPPCHHAGCSQ